MTDDGGEWSRPGGDDTDHSPWWTPPPASSGGTGRAGRSWSSTSPSWTMLVLVSAVTAVLGGTIGGLVAHHGSSSADSAPRTVQLGAPALPVTSSHRPLAATAAVAAKILPSVVSIEVRRGSGGDTGSGIVISSSGYILTNNHVVEPALNGGKLSVVFHDKQSVHGEIVGRDKVSDLAVIRVRGVRGLQPAVLGSSSSVAVGDPVIAVGSPLGLAGTVTSGIISALDRPVEAGSVGGTSTEDVIDAIQTDAAINPGNSGGPLVDGRGQVIGVNSAIATLSADPIGGGQGGSIGLGFAIPIDQAKRIAQQIITQGYSTHAIIGVRLDAAYDGNGAKIIKGSAGAPGVSPGGPAQRAGLQGGDVIVAVDGEPVTSADELIVAIRRHVPGQRLTVTYLRNGDRHTTVVTLGSAPSD
ncbi:MAG TPA: trypsin-like peptidase domain-containing protein [Mycobacteriales bacterium]|nr:trypsin-like peptidase domain-containing protein [Mycobacteriales bacterium]